MRFGMTALAILANAALAARAHASCSIHNGTRWEFTVESGHTSNQLVNSHTQTTIDAGKIIGKSKEGKSISGFCKDGDQLEVTEDDGVAVLAPK